MTLYLLVFLHFTLQGKMKLVDKIVGIFNGEIITLSQIKRIQSTIPARNEVAEIIYKKKAYSKKELLELLMERYLIRSRLKEMNQPIEDDSVEKYIKHNVERRLNISRKQLIAHLASSGITFDEFFELYRQNLEYSSFHQQIVAPLVTITEQEVKNAFYKLNYNNKTLAFRYILTDYSLPQDLFKKNMLNRFRQIMIKYRTHNILPSDFARVESTNMGEIKEEDLTDNLKKILKKVDEGSFSNPILIGNRYHVFYINKKNLEESGLFIKAKERIYRNLYEERIKRTSHLWFKEEKKRHYIKYFL